MRRERPDWLPQVFTGETHMRRHRQRALTAFAAIIVLALILGWPLLMTLVAAVLLVDDMLDGPGEDRP